MWGEGMGKTNAKKTKIDYSKYFMAENGYPFTVGARYVYYSSLANVKTPQGVRAYDDAVNYLNSGLGQLTSSKNGEPQTKMDIALQYLQKAASNERVKEEKFIENFLKQFPEKQLPLGIESVKDDYMKLIIKLNSIIKNFEPFKKQLEQELARAEERKKLISEAENLVKDITDSKERSQIKSEHYYSNRTQLSSFQNDDKTGKTSTVINSIFSNKSNISILTEIIIKKYGSKLFTIRKQLELNGSEMNSLLKTLIDKANEIFIITKGIEATKIKTQDNIPQYQEEMEKIIEGKEFTNFIESLEKSSALKPALTSMAKQMGMDKNVKEIENIEQQIETIKNRLLQSYKQTRPHGRRGKNFDKWRKEIGADDETLKQMYLSSQNVSIQHYYASEQITLMEMIAAGLDGTLGGNKNPTNDYLAGRLFFTITENEKVNQKIEKAQKLISSRREDAFKNIQTTTDLASYRANITTLRNLRTKQNIIIQQTLQSIEDEEGIINNFLNSVNIHGSIKGYISIGENNREYQGLQGASFGSNIFEQLSIIQETMNGFLTSTDINWLLFAMLNAGSGAIGQNNKSSLENYFSTMIGFLMFNDAQLMFEDAIKQIGYNDTGANDIHLYTINGIYMPNSFILQQTYNTLIKASADIKSNLKGGIKATLYTYNNGPINSDGHLETSDWEATSEAAMGATKLDMHFLAGILDILSNINEAMSF